MKAFMEVFIELKNRYIKHIEELKSKTYSIVTNLQSITDKDFESVSYAPYYNEVKKMGINYSFELLVKFLPEVNILFHNIYIDMIENPEDFFNIHGKIIDKKRKLVNHINLVLNNSQYAKNQFKNYFELTSEPSLEQVLSIVNACSSNMSRDDCVKIAKQLEIEYNLKHAALSKVGGNNKKNLQSIRKAIRKQALRRIISKRIR